MRLFIIIALLLLTALSLVGGVVLSSVGGNFYVKYRNKIMILRVALQAIAVVAALLLMR